jgi:hypothetical protein
MSGELSVEFALRGTLYRDGVPIEAPPDDGKPRGHNCIVRVRVSPDMLENSGIDLLPLFIDQLCEGLRYELTRIYAGMKLPEEQEK